MLRRCLEFAQGQTRPGPCPAAGAGLVLGPRPGRPDQPRPQAGACPRRPRTAGTRAEQPREQLVELLIGDAARDPVGHPWPVEPGALVAEGLHRVWWACARLPRLERSRETG